jgi:hypothetical protein
MNAGPRELGPPLARLEIDDDCIAVWRDVLAATNRAKDIGVSVSEAPIWHCSSTWPAILGQKLVQRGQSQAKRRRMTMDERPRLTASEIEAQLLAELQKLPSLRDTQSVRIRPYSGPKGWTWELDSIEPEVGPRAARRARSPRNGGPSSNSPSILVDQRGFEPTNLSLIEGSFGTRSAPTSASAPPTPLSI